MKKLIALLLFSGLALTACSSNKTDANSSSSSKEKTEQTATSSSSEKDQKKIEEEAEKMGIKKKTLRNAKMELGIDSVKRGNQWYWMLSE